MLNKFKLMLNKLKLAPKFTLLLFSVFMSALVMSGTILWQESQYKAREEMNYQASLIMDMMLSVRDYTTKHVNPLLAPKVETESNFIPETVPAFSATEVFRNLQKNQKYQDFSYKEAVINPTNIKTDKADSFEIKIINQFRKKLYSKAKPKADFTTRSGKKVFYTTRPISITDKSCLRCHSIPKNAPKSLLATYGKKNGFGWKLNDILGVQIIYVPSQKVYAIANQYFALVMVIFSFIFFVVILLIIFLLKRTIIQPIKPMARLAQKISNEQLSSNQDEESDIVNLGKVAKNSDELGQLARVFQQMAHAIYTREQSFAQQLQQLRANSEQMQGRTSSRNNRLAYFRALQQKAQMIRNRAKGSS